MEITDKRLNKVIKILVIVTLALTSVYILAQFSGLLNTIFGVIKAILIPFLIAFLINFILYPVVLYAEKKGIRPRWLIVTALYIFIFGIIALIMGLLIPVVIEQVKELIVEKIPQIYKSINQTIDKLNIKNSPTLIAIYTKLQEEGQRYLMSVIISAGSSISNIISFLLTLVLSPIILFYMLNDYNEIREGIYRIIPVKYKIHFYELVKRANETLGSYIRGHVLLMISIGVFATLGYLVIGLDYAVVFGIIVGLTNIIPYVGSIIAAVIPISYSILVGGTPWYTILLFNMFIQFVEGNIFQPLIMSKQLNLHPLIILAAVIGFGSVFGVIGIIIAVPLAGLTKVWIEYFRELKNKPPESNDL